MRLRQSIGFFILGFISIIAEVCLQREIVADFYGNELFIALFIGAWLIWTAIGANTKTVLSLPNLYALTGFSTLVSIVAIRLVKHHLGFAGEIPDLVASTAIVIIIPSITSFFLGQIWTSLNSENSETRAEFLGNGYAIETAGFTIGGLLFGLAFVLLNNISVSIIIVIVCILYSLFIRTSHKITIAKCCIFLLVAGLSLLILYQPSNKLNSITEGLSFSGQIPIEFRNSQYGTLAVTEANGQVNFYSNGIPIYSSAKNEFTEEIIHLPMLMHENPKSALIVGGEFTLSINEALKHNLDNITYIEIDPVLTELSRKYLSLELQRKTFDKRVNIINTDARHFLETTNKQFDVVIVDLPPPSTILLNRYYTLQFYNAIKSHLNPNGVIATHLPFSQSTPLDSLTRLNSSIYKAMTSVGLDIIILSEDQNIFIASNTASFKATPQELIERFRGRGIETSFIGDEYLRYKFENKRNYKALVQIQDDYDAKINLDTRPIAYLYQNTFWLNIFYTKIANLVSWITNNVGYVLSAILIISFLALYFTGFKGTLSARMSMAVAGFTLMALEIIWIISYQIFIGFLFARIAFFIAAIMLGMCIGTITGNKLIDKNSCHLKQLKILMLGSALFVSSSIIVIAPISHSNNLLLIEIILLLMAIISGFFGGAIFPISNAEYILQKGSAMNISGKIYSLDLIGSAIGATITPVLMIPIIGIEKTLAVIVIINITAAMVMHLNYFHGED